MIIDFRSLPNKSKLECDLCIIGGGAAGITLALEFANSGVDIILLESGGLEFNEETQALYKGENIGLPYFDLEYTRLRYFGGSTNHWGGMCRPLDAIDFVKRDWVAHSGWPITFDGFSRYLPRARKVCEVPTDNYDASYWIQRIQHKDRNFQRDVEYLNNLREEFSPGVFHFSPPTRFGQTYLSQLEKAKNIKALLNSNVTSINTKSNPHQVDQIQIKSTTGNNASISSKQVILATGGIENARLLLASNMTHTRGLGNMNDLVGRYFADHIELESGFILSRHHNNFFKLFSILYNNLYFSLDLTAETQQLHNLVNLGFTLSRASTQTRTSDGVSSARRLAKSLSRGKWPNDFFSDIGTTLIDIDDVISYAWTKDKPSKLGLFSIMNRVEPQPNPSSRITLSDDIDALGMRKVKLDWQLTELDYNSIYRSQKILARLMGKTGYGRINIELDENFVNWPDAIQGGNHHMGTTRMADSPKNGVVDKNCKVFGIENLYIAGSSVFPTYGKANPTLNLVALTLRLADHLKDKMGVKK